MKNKNNFWDTFIPEIDWDFRIPQPMWLIVVEWVSATIFAVIAGVVIALAI